MSVAVEILFYNDHRQDERVRRSIERSRADHVIVITKSKLVENLGLNLIGSVNNEDYLFTPLDDEAYVGVGSELHGGIVGERKILTASMDDGKLGQMKLEEGLTYIVENFVREINRNEEKIIVGVNMDGANTREAFAVCNVSSYLPMLVFCGNKRSDIFPTIPRYVPLNGEQLSVLKQFHLTFKKDGSNPILTSSDITENTGKNKRNVDRTLEFLRENGLIEKTDADKVRKSAGKIPTCYKITDDGRTMLLINLRARGILPYFENPSDEISSMVHHKKTE